ncbi:MAG: hypothetical protein GXO14_01450 [Thermococci archaeon]|nr:hypothetical protein [Thermococci archaeon]
MRRSFVFLISVVVLFGLASVGSADSYNLPGSGYNNMGLRGEVTFSINVTLVNLAPYPKFVVVNPRYDFIVHRFNGSENMHAILNGTSVVHVLPRNLRTNTLNYRVGFWIFPYEVVNVTFSITRYYPYPVQLKAYTDLCKGQDGLDYLRYINATFVSGKIREYQDISLPVCGVAYPQLLNAPEFINFNYVMATDGGYVKMLKYSGVVRFNLTNVPDESGQFPLFFAVSVPVVFMNATQYGYTPAPNMNYTSYVSFILNYRNIAGPKGPEVQLPKHPENGLFNMTNTLISGVKITKPQLKFPSLKPLDFPVWIVYMDGEARSFTIEYKVRWVRKGSG